MTERLARRLFLAFVTAVAVFLAVRACRAGELGGCWSEGRWCAGPSASATVAEFNLASGKFSGGISPGIGYGITWQRQQWYATGAALYLAFSVGGSQPNHARPALLVSFANYVRAGVAVDVTERDAGGPLVQWSLLFGLGADFGGRP